MHALEICVLGQPQRWFGLFLEIHKHFLENFTKSTTLVVAPHRTAIPQDLYFKTSTTLLAQKIDITRVMKAYARGRKVYARFGIRV